MFFTKATTSVQRITWRLKKPTSGILPAIWKFIHDQYVLSYSNYSGQDPQRQCSNIWYAYIVQIYKWIISLDKKLKTKFFCNFVKGIDTNLKACPCMYVWFSKAIRKVIHYILCVHNNLQVPASITVTAIRIVCFLLYQSSLFLPSFPCGYEHQDLVDLY